MSSYIVAYDLHKQGQNYECLIQKLKQYGTHWHVQQSVWIVISDQTSSQIRDFLSPCLDTNDKLIVAKLSGEAAWRGYTDAVSQWLKQYL
jgi:CRISPR/Cas system-associated endoribonuclease Cas2